MILPQAVKDELKTKIETSELREDAKARVLALLSKEDFTQEDAEEISALIQDDIDADFDSIPGFAERFLGSDGYRQLEEEEQKAEAAYDAKLGEVEEQLRGATTTPNDMEAVRLARIEEVKKNLEGGQ